MKASSLRTLPSFGTTVDDAKPKGRETQTTNQSPQPLLTNCVRRSSNPTFLCVGESTPFVLWTQLFGGKRIARQFCTTAFSSPIHRPPSERESQAQRPAGGWRHPGRQAEEKQKRIEFLGKKVQTKDAVLAELMADHIALRKSLGELWPRLGYRTKCRLRG